MAYQMSQHFNNHHLKSSDEKTNDRSVRNRSASFAQCPNQSPPDFKQPIGSAPIYIKEMSHKIRKKSENDDNDRFKPCITYTYGVCLDKKCKFSHCDTTSQEQREKLQALATERFDEYVGDVAEEMFELEL
jgi:hypothetical protein